MPLNVPGTSPRNAYKAFREAPGLFFRAWKAGNGGVGADTDGVCRGMCDEDAEAMSRERIGHRGLAKDCQARWDRAVAAKRKASAAKKSRRKNRR